MKTIEVIQVHQVDEVNGVNEVDEVNGVNEEHEVLNNELYRLQCEMV